jgi:CRP/FNR family transcriptional regulator, cyclic AMP receptor protein
MIDTDILLAWGAAYKKLSAGDALFREGVKGNFYYQLVSGKVRWININDNGKEFLQEIIIAGESLGELTLFDNEPYAATAIADTNCLVLRLSRSSFQQLIAESPAILLSFTRLMAQRLRFRLFILKELADHNPEHTIAALLSYFRKKHTNICPLTNRITLTRQQIASMTGLRVETVIRTIMTLQEKGQLHIEKGKVFVDYDSDHTEHRDTRLTLHG